MSEYINSVDTQTEAEKLFSDKAENLLEVLEQEKISDFESLKKKFYDFYNANPDLKPSRDTFRNAAKVPDSVWKSLKIDKFSDLLIAVGYNSKAVSKRNSEITQATYEFPYREINAERKTWAGKYTKDLTGRFQTILIGSDFHDFNCDNFFMRMFLTAAKRIQPDIITINGDLFDFAEYSGKYPVDPRLGSVSESLKWGQDFFAKLREVAPHAQVDMTEGNHEYRILNYIVGNAAQLGTHLKDFMNIDVKNLLGLDRFGVNYYARGSLGKFNKTNITVETMKNHVIYNNQVLFTHQLSGRNHGLPGASGHHHQHIVWTDYNHEFGPYEWHQTGGGVVRYASYTDAAIKWTNGFLIAHLDTLTKRTTFEYIDCTNQHCVIGGETYLRTEEELKTWI